MSNVLAIPGFLLFALNVSNLHRVLGYERVQESERGGQLLTALQIMFFGWLSEKLNERLLVAAWSNIWMLPFFIGIIAIPPDASPWIRYAMLTGINGIPYTHSILVGMTSRNAGAVSRRTVSAAVYNMCYQVGSIIAVNVYRDDDKPYC